MLGNMAAIECPRPGSLMGDVLSRSLSSSNDVIGTARQERRLDLCIFVYLIEEVVFVCLLIFFQYCCLFSPFLY